MAAGGGVKLPIRNCTSRPVNLFIEPVCDEYEVPVGAEAIVTLPDGLPHSIELQDGLIVIWNEANDFAGVEIIPPKSET